jgi:hypothetical protein
MADTYTTDAASESGVGHARERANSPIVVTPFSQTTFYLVAGR